MSLHYILDGYNIIHQITILAHMKLEDQRSALLKLIDIKQPQGSPKNKVTVVFDGKANAYSPASPSSSRVIFSVDETADERIVKLVNEAAHKKSLIIVTNDRAVQYAVKACGAAVQSVEEFWAKLSRTGPKGFQPGNAQADSGGRDKNIPYTTEMDITAELKKIWLKDK